MSGSEIIESTWEWVQQTLNINQQATNNEKLQANQLEGCRWISKRRVTKPNNSKLEKLGHKAKKYKIHFSETKKWEA